MADARKRSNDHMTPSFPHPLIVADIGGTNCRLGVIEQEGAVARPIGRIDTQGAGELHDAIADFVRRSGAPAPHSALLAVAGPVTGARMAITNANRMLDGPALGVRLGLKALMLVNDFEAQAAALATLRDSDVVTLRAGEPEPQGVRLAAGPGTGFGVGFLVDAGAARAVVPSEGGHIAFGPETPEEESIWPDLDRIGGHVTIESALRGDGLARIYAALARIDGEKAPAPDAAGVTSLAVEQGHPRARAAAALYLDLLARAVADLALVGKATGGVYIAGGVTPRLLPLLDAKRFADRFSNRPPMSAMLRRLPIHVITTEYAAFAGLGALADPASRVRASQPAFWAP